MAHAYDTLAQDGQSTSGTMAAQSGGPVGILKVTDSDGHLVEADNGASGVNEVKSQQVIPSTVAQTTKSILQTVVASGTGTHAQTGGYVWGKTGTTTSNGDAWFVGATEDITVAIWVGYPNSNKPMSTLYNGGPVDGGTIPADMFSEIISAWDGIKASERAHRKHGGQRYRPRARRRCRPTRRPPPQSPPPSRRRRPLHGRGRRGHASGDARSRPGAHTARARARRHGRRSSRQRGRRGRGRLR